jgi:hypothetical protein
MPADPGIGIGSNPNIVATDLPGPHQDEDQYGKRGYCEYYRDGKHQIATRTMAQAATQGAQGNRAFPWDQNDQRPASDAMDLKEGGGEGPNQAIETRKTKNTKQNEDESVDET